MGFAPVFERASQQHPDVVFGKVDTEAQSELAATLGISSIPTLMIIRDKMLLYAQPGALPQAALEKLISKARQVDMAEVRPSVAAQRKPDEHRHRHSPRWSPDSNEPRANWAGSSR